MHKLKVLCKMDCLAQCVSNYWRSIFFAIWNQIESRHCHSRKI